MFAAAALASVLAAGAALAQSVDELLEELLEEQLIDGIEERLESTLETVLDEVGDLDAVLDGVTEILPDPDAPFLDDVDPDGRRIERNVLVVLTTPAHAAEIGDQGYDVRELRRLETLGQVLIRVAFREEDDLAEARAALIEQAPGARVDYNHLYEGTREAKTTEAAAAAGRFSRRVRVPVGIVDTAVADHEAFRRARIERRDFVSHDGPRPTDHGTAVASILVGDADRVRGVLPGARLFAASVFFETEQGAEVATTAALAQALDWLSGARVRVINMSLAGPPNAILEAVLERVTERGIVVVAAVGNNGPVGKPRHPAAYDSVLGITAVDAAGRVYRYAARGPQVAFAGLGVDVAVARGDGGYGRESGTSMAVPVAAAVIAHRLAREGTSPDRVLPVLRAAARDLGDAGFDETFGHGLLAPPD